MHIVKPSGFGFCRKACDIAVVLHSRKLWCLEWQSVATLADMAMAKDTYSSSSHWVLSTATKTPFFCLVTIKKLAVFPNVCSAPIKHPQIVLYWGKWWKRALCAQVMSYQLVQGITLHSPYIGYIRAVWPSALEHLSIKKKIKGWNDRWHSRDTDGSYTIS